MSGYYRVTLELLVLADTKTDALEEAQAAASRAVEGPNVLAVYHDGEPFRLTASQRRTDAWATVQGR